MAYYSLNQEENAILQIQRILRDLAFYETQLAPVRLSGTYDDDTRDAVVKFQQKYDLEPTGTVNAETWAVLQSVDRARRDSEALARAVYILPRSPEYTIYPGTRDNVIFVIQHMLEVISQEYGELEGVALNGVYDESTAEAVKAFQRANLLESNGIIDPITFNRLADEYERINSYNQ